MNELRELQLIELDILKEVDKICKKHNITYYLGEGTLLGAIRHNGFIPWDDDLDLIMERKEYEKFLSVAPKEISKNYHIQHATTTKNYWSPFIKVRLLDNSKYCQQHISHLTKANGPYLDIFPMDNVPLLTSRKQTLQSLKIRFLRKSLSLKLGLMKPKDITQIVIKFMSNFIGVKRIHKKLDKTFKMYNNDNNKYTVNLASYYNVKKQTVPNDVYSKPRYIKFEDGMYPVPNKAEFLLEKIYGNYLELPPIEKRVIKHHFNQNNSEE